MSVVIGPVNLRGVDLAADVRQIPWSTSKGRANRSRGPQGKVLPALSRSTQYRLRVSSRQSFAGHAPWEDCVRNDVSRMVRLGTTIRSRNVREDSPQDFRTGRCFHHSSRTALRKLVPSESFGQSKSPREQLNLLYANSQADRLRNVNRD